MVDPVADALNRLVTAISGSLQLTTRSVLSNDVYRPFQDTGTITGTTGLDVWDPGAGMRFICRGGMVGAVVSTVLAAADEGFLYFQDSGTSKVVAPIGPFAAASTAGVSVTGPFPQPLQFDLKDGVKGSVLGAKIRIKSTIDLTSGVIAVCGILWGTEVPA